MAYINILGPFYFEGGLWTKDGTAYGSGYSQAVSITGTGAHDIYVSNITAINLQSSGLKATHGAYNITFENNFLDNMGWIVFSYLGRGIQLITSQ